MNVPLDRESPRSISFPVIRLQQPIGEFYIAKIEARPLHDISWVDTPSTLMKIMSHTNILFPRLSVAGFASFGDFRAWPGYRFTVEGTIHIQSDLRGQGVGTALLQELVKRAREMGKHTMIAGVDAENTASLRFLERFGFQQVAHFREVGFKFDRFLDLIFLQYWLSAA